MPAFGGLILMLGVFAFGSSGFKANSQNAVDDSDCDQVAVDAWWDTLLDGYPLFLANVSYQNAFDNCILLENGSSENEITVVLN